jgi:hypothetical protein
LIKDNSIYKGNPIESHFNRIRQETIDFSFLSGLFSIPYSYIKKIENQTGKNYLKIYFGNDSEEELYIDNEAVKNEIFSFLKADIPNLRYSSEVPSVLKYAKAQFFALLFTTLIFIWSLYLAIQIENGVQYELIGSGRSITGIVLVIAELGVIKIVIGYLLILAIILFGLIRRLKTRTETEMLTR